MKDVPRGDQLHRSKQRGYWAAFPTFAILGGRIEKRIVTWSWPRRQGPWSIREATPMTRICLSSRGTPCTNSRIKRKLYSYLLNSVAPAMIAAASMVIVAFVRNGRS